MAIDQQELLNRFEAERLKSLARAKIAAVVVVIGLILGGLALYMVRFEQTRPRTDAELSKLADPLLGSSDAQGFETLMSAELYRRSRSTAFKEGLADRAASSLKPDDARTALLDMANLAKANADPEAESSLVLKAFNLDKQNLAKCKLTATGFDPPTAAQNCIEDLQRTPEQKRSSENSALLCWLQTATGGTPSIPDSLPSNLSQDGIAFYWAAYYQQKKNIHAVWTFHALGLKEGMAASAVANSELANGAHISNAAIFADRGVTLAGSDLTTSVSDSVKKAQAILQAAADSISTSIQSVLKAQSGDYQEGAFWGALADNVNTDTKLSLDGKPNKLSVDELRRPTFGPTTPVIISNLIVRPDTKDTLDLGDDTASSTFSYDITASQDQYDRGEADIEWVRVGSDMKIKSIDFRKMQKMNVPPAPAAVPTPPSATFGGQ